MADKIQCPKCNASIFVNVQFCPKCGEKIRVQEFRKEDIGDFYKILQVDPSAEQEVIEAAYKRLAAKYHPDVNKSADAQTRMQEINRAYQVLSKEESRRQYDLTSESQPDKARMREAEAAEKKRQEEAKKHEGGTAAKRTATQKKLGLSDWVMGGTISLVVISIVVIVVIVCCSILYFWNY